MWDSVTTAIRSSRLELAISWSWGPVRICGTSVCMMERNFFKTVYNKHLLNGLSEHAVYVHTWYCKCCLADPRLPEYGQEARQRQATEEDGLCCGRKSLLKYELAQSHWDEGFSLAGTAVSGRDLLYFCHHCYVSKSHSIYEVTPGEKGIFFFLDNLMCSWKSKTAPAKGFFASVNCLCLYNYTNKPLQEFTRTCWK